ncbi:dienelactone hydrolase [Scheffersomyces coipomensis]|uniref:dienelactone hydrolase n=1 Tax=Scheffersomyces coipomensis TaxID=1788519 RepID=UPI00315D2A3B
MASNPPGECCTKGSLHEGTPKGKNQTIFGLDTYQVGQEHGNDRIIVILTDIMGHNNINGKLIADELSNYKYQVLIPDIILNDPIKGDLSEWLSKHSAEVTAPIVDPFLSSIKKDLKPKFFGAIGYCFGAKYLVQNLTKDGPLDAGAIAHPSFVSIEEVKAIAKPIIISAAEIDPIFTVELRHQTEAELIKLGARFQINLYSGVSHSFANRGDVSDPIVKYAKERALVEQISFFSQY